MLYNLFSSQLLSLIILYYICPPLLSHSFTYTSILTCLLRTTLNLCMTEVFFTLSHGLLHTLPLLAPLHRMHHCCTHSSWCTNFIFHPLDLMIEFSAPVGFLIVAHVWLWQDTMTLCVSFTLLQIWYVLMHILEYRTKSSILIHRYCTLNLLNAFVFVV